MGQHTVIGTKYDADGNPHDVLEAKYCTLKKRPSGLKWFQCPVTADWLREDEGVEINGTLYSPEGARDILVEKRKKRLRR